MASDPGRNDARFASFVARLYAAPLASFVAARKGLAIELRSLGAADLAKRMLALPKPSRSAWALAQVARQSAGEIQAVLAATNAVRDAQARAFKERNPAIIRDAGRELNAKIQEVVRSAARVLEAAGTPTSAANERAIGQTLHALASAGAGDVAALLGGTLAVDLEPASDFAVFADVPAAAPREDAPTAPNAENSFAAEREEASLPRKELEEARRKAAEAQLRAREAARLAKAADDAERAATRVEQAAADAARVAKELEARAKGARAEAERARAAEEAFQKELPRA
jgi:hypothetical protein